MIVLPYQSYVAWRVFVTIYHAIAILSTIFRIRTRYTNRKMWIDDYLIVLPTITDFIYCIAPWVLPALIPDPRKIAVFYFGGVWLVLTILVIITWLSRICFMLSLARIFPSGSSTRRFILFIVVLFSIIFCSIILLISLHCDPLNPAKRHCVNFLGADPAAKYSYIVEATCDVIMIITPLAVLWKINLPKLEKRVILMALSSSSLSVLLFALLMFFNFGPFQMTTLPYTIVILMIPNLIAATSLLSSNMLIIVTSVFRLYRRRFVHEEEGQMPTASEIDAHSSQSGNRLDLAPAFDLEKSKADANHRLSKSYPPDGTTERERSGAPVSTFILTQISMEDYESEYGPGTHTSGPSTLASTSSRTPEQSYS